MLDEQWNLNIQSLQILSFLLILEAFSWTPGKFPKMELSLASYLPEAQHPKMGLDIVPLATTICFLITKARFGTSLGTPNSFSHTCIFLVWQTGLPSVGTAGITQYSSEHFTQTLNLVSVGLMHTVKGLSLLKPEVCRVHRQEWAMWGSTPPSRNRSEWYGTTHLGL